MTERQGGGPCLELNFWLNQILQLLVSAHALNLIYFLKVKLIKSSYGMSLARKMMWQILRILILVLLSLRCMMF